MKTKPLLLLALAIAALFSIAADSPTIVDNLTMIQCDPRPADPQIQSFWQKTIDLHDGQGPKRYEDATQTNWNASATGTVEIALADGSKAQVTYVAVLAANVVWGRTKSLADGSKAQVTYAAVLVASVAIATAEHAKK